MAIRRLVFGITQLAVMAIAAGPSTEQIVDRMTAASKENTARLRPYEVVRRYELVGKEAHSAKSVVTANVAYLPPDGQRYTLQKIAGIGLGESIVRKILENEKAVLANPRENDIATYNYAFNFIREDTLDGYPCYVLEIKPSRKDLHLLTGEIWIDQTSYLIRRIAGELAKLPSWWVHNVYVILHFHDVDGMWLQTDLKSTANVRLFGEHTLLSRDVEYKMLTSEAAVNAKRKNDE
jgi:hypothetical protein